MNKYIRFDFEYDGISDVLSIFDFNKPIKESIEFNEYLNIDLGKNGEIVGLEIFDVSKFLSVLNNDVDKNFFKKLKKVELVQADYRNNWFIAIILYSEDKQIYQQLPPIQKNRYVSPLIEYSSYNN
ncbi:DUF2283 domain-containing protein [Candidatus Pacearchaeota archaeon]|nr:DUF2283 domain-containing protein [Candidatus Pacearchaeota archaeon]